MENKKRNCKNWSNVLKNILFYAFSKLIFSKKMYMFSKFRISIPPIITKQNCSQTVVRHVVGIMTVIIYQQFRIDFFTYCCFRCSWLTRWSKRICYVYLTKTIRKVFVHLWWQKLKNEFWRNRKMQQNTILIQNFDCKNTTLINIFISKKSLLQTHCSVTS